MLAIIGLGYVGLPLAVEFGKYRPTLGFDVNQQRIAALQAGHDATLEVSDEEMVEAKHLRYSADPEALREASVFIVTVPTPIDDAKQPDLSYLRRASETVGRNLKRGDLVIYESTVFPGCTEEVCVPELEKHSGLAFNQDFFCGYSPERINPGDKTHRLPTIKKVVSGSTAEVAQKVQALYDEIITAGTHLASSIRVAEASKVIENAQRDLNIAFVNELALIFSKMGIDTREVLEAAGTKWNFLPFTPGLVGGHCIGVDPYYLTHKAQQIGYHPEVILAGRRINDDMPRVVASTVVKLMIEQELMVKNAKILVLGITFKENCPDIRNSKVADLVEELAEFGTDVHLHDPWANAEEVREEYGLQLRDPESGGYAAIILAVSHREFADFPTEKYLLPGGVVYDVKAFWDKDKVTQRL